MRNWWKSLGITAKLNIPIQVMLVCLLSIANLWVMGHVKERILNGAERRAIVSADGVINGMNMLMVTGMISDPDNRRLFIKKMSASEDVESLRIIRAKQVQDQFGIGLPEEQIQDNLDRLAITSKRKHFLLDENSEAPTLRAVVPFIVSTNFRGTNCLNCHHVKPGSVNGAASITIDMSEDLDSIKDTQNLLWLGQFMLQILIFFASQSLIRRFLRPIVTLQGTMALMQSSGSMAQFTPIEIDKGNQDEIGKLTAAFNEMSATICQSEKSMKLATAIYQSNFDAIIVTDEKNRITDVNPAFSRVTGYTPDEVIGKNPNIMQSGQHDSQFYRSMWRAILEQGHWQGEIWDKRKNGEFYAKLANIIALRNSDGSVYRYVAQFSDITEKKQKDELIHWQANYEPLTNLPNRRLFHDRMGQAIKLAHRTALPIALLFIDLDHFKEINDTLGHDYGDSLLMEAARRISSCVREADTVARLGGDEFTVILPELGKSVHTKRIVEDIVAKMALPFLFMNNETEYFISASIGIALYPDHANDLVSLLKCADQAMYLAKTKGRNRYEYYSTPDAQIEGV